MTGIQRLVSVYLRLCTVPDAHGASPPASTRDTGFPRLPAGTPHAPVNHDAQSHQPQPSSAN